MRMLDSVFNKENLVKIRCIMLVMMIHQLFMMILWIISWKCRWWWWEDSCWSSGGGGWRHQLWSVSCSPAPLAHVSHGLHSCHRWHDHSLHQFMRSVQRADTSQWSHDSLTRDITHTEKFSALLSSYSVAAASVKSYIIRLLRRNNLNFSER